MIFSRMIHRRPRNKVSAENSPSRGVCADTPPPEPCSSGRESAPSAFPKKSEPPHVGCYSLAGVARHALHCFTGLLSFALVLGAQAEGVVPPATTNATNPLVWDAMEKQVDLPGMTNVAFFTFWVTNTAPTNLTVGAVEAECDCTVIDARKRFPWSLAPGESGSLDARVNIRGRFGLFVKTIDVHTSRGKQVLTVRMNIPLTPALPNVSARQKDLMAAQADRQAVFRGSCAVCHAAPATGLTGRVLFEKACAICHAAEQRAEIVPDLAALPNATDADYWRAWITSGEAGSVMPAFGKSKGGILDPNQIESLVEYLLREFPSQAASAKQPLPTAATPQTSTALPPPN
jgi:mono/diheme cytochrome c family protein